MLPNLFDRALSTLREERPSPEATARLRAALNSLPLGRGRGGASRRRLARPLALTMITAVLSLVIFLPRAKTGSAWAQTLAATLAAPASHSVSRWANGRLASEDWRSGRKRATVLYLQTGEVQMETRNDATRSLNFFNWRDVSRTQGDEPSPNALRWALVSKGVPADPNWAETPLGSPKLALDDPDVKTIGHAPAAGGRPETYRLQQIYRLGGKEIGRSTPFTAEIDPISGRIRALVQDPRTINGRKQTFRTEIDYPASIPASIFVPKVQVAKVDATYDLDATKGAVQRTLRKGLGKRGPVTLRSVLLDGEGALWTYWTGAPETRTLTLRGVPREGGAQRNAFPSGLTGLRVVPLRKLGSTVDLDIPYPGGVARFRGVPVRRIGFTTNVTDVLMAFRKSL